MSSIGVSWQKHKSAWLFTIFWVAALYVIVPQLGNLHDSWHLIARAELAGLLTAFILTSLTYFFAAGIYYFLVFQPINYWQAVLVQLGAMFVNKLLPAGIGALGANYAYLKHKSHSSLQAASVVAVNDLMGVIGHLICLGVVLALSYNPAKQSYDAGKIAPFHLIGIAVILILVFSIIWLVARARLIKLISGLWSQLLIYKLKQSHLALALMASVALTLSNVLCLHFCAIALHIHVSLAVTIIVFSLGVGAGAAIPTPGGLGGYEAGLFAGFVAYHIASAESLALALLYRLVSYWLPLLFGAPAFIICQKRKYFSKPESATSLSG
jgi:uncharacterized membrane protein YbhN (UPF0104 family)